MDFFEISSVSALPPIQRQRFNVVIIGAGQAGLSVGYHLARLGIPFVILDANKRIGDSWRKRWDSLRLFTPARYDGLDGMRFPGSSNRFPTKDEMADYLEAYAAHFKLPVRMGVKVERVTRSGNTYVISAGDHTYEAEHVVVAMATYQRGVTPPFAKDLGPAIRQLHSSDYRSPSQLNAGGVLIVGAGNSGAEIAVEVARDHPTWMSGRDTGHAPIRLNRFIGRRVLAPLLFRVIFHRVLTTSTRLGRKVRPHVIHRGAPLIRVRSEELAAAGVKRIARISGIRDGLPMLADGPVLEVANVIWCTGFHPGFSWIDLPIFGEDGEPAHERGVVANEPGFYFIGLHFLYAFSSTMIHGIGRDAAHIAKTVSARVLTTEASTPPPLRQLQYP
jgi:putative flavoprotein involved in K+ transport